MMLFDPFYKLLGKEQRYVPLDKDNIFQLKLYLQKIYCNDKLEIFGED